MGALPHVQYSMKAALFRVLLSLCALMPLVANAQETPRRTRILFVMDASNSMNGFWGNEPKINAARRVLLAALKPLSEQPDVELALRVYGHQTRIETGKQDCEDTRLEVPFAPNNGPAIRDRLNTIYCLGTTPIARSLEKAAGDFPDNTTRNVIILITDGIEACDEDPCAVSRALQARGVVLKPFVIGVGIDETSAYSLKCVGNYYDASTPERFDRVLRLVVEQALNTTTTQLLLLTDDSRPVETDVAVTFFDQRSGAVHYNFVHTLNSRGNPDTLNIDPVYTYRIVAHTLPPSERTDVTIEPGRNNVIAMMAGQGELELSMAGDVASNEAVQCLVRQSGDPAIIHVQEMSTVDRYRTGLYDLEVLTLPRLRIPDVRIEQDKRTPVRIPRSGMLNIRTTEPAVGSVLLVRDGTLEWVCDLDPTLTENQFRLLPGDYKVVLRPTKADQTILGMELNATVRSNQATNIEPK